MQTCYQALTDSRWAIIEKIIGDTRARQHDLRTICDAILWINYTGSQWRMLDSAFPCWQSVYYYFSKWTKTGVWEQVLDQLVAEERQRNARKISPSLLAFDSQSVKVSSYIEEETGIDGGKRINGRKRHMATDTLGLPLALHVSAGNISDSEAGKELARQLHGKVPRLKKICCDTGYKEGFVAYVKENHGWEVEIAQKPESSIGFVPQAGRWPVERSFGWLNFRRRLSKDYEKTVESSLAMLQIAFISFIILRLTE